MKYSRLLYQRDALLRQARLSNLAFAYQRLGDFAARIARAGLGGEVRVRRPDPGADRPWPVMVANEASRAVVEEHFLDEDIVELADILAFLSDENGASEFVFRFEELERTLLPGLKENLEKAGVSVEHRFPPVADSNRGHG